MHKTSVCAPHSTYTSCYVYTSNLCADLLKEYRLIGRWPLFLGPEEIYGVKFRTNSVAAAVEL